MRTFTFVVPMTVGSVSSPVTVASLQVTSVYYSTTPELAPIGTAELEITLTDPATGWQETIRYQDASVLALLEGVGDEVAQALFAKLIADGKLPAGTLA